MKNEATIEQIGKKDVAWSIGANVLRIGHGVILFPIILHRLPSEEVAIWSIFASITALVFLLDFGFSATFARNVAYVFSGVQQLQKEGIAATNTSSEVNYSLLKSLIQAMKRFYTTMSIVAFVLLACIGTPYVFHLLKNFSHNPTHVYYAWGLLCLVLSYNIYTLYYEGLLQGKGYVKASKQYAIVGSVIHLIVATVLVLLGFGIVAIVVAQLCSIVVTRLLTKRKFYTPQLRQALDNATVGHYNVLQQIAPNATKVGLTALGGFAVLKSSLLIGAIYIPLEQLACYGITTQIIAIVDSIARSYTQSYSPRICQLWVSSSRQTLRTLYFKCAAFCAAVFVAFASGIVWLGPWALELIESQTQLLPQAMLIPMFVIAWLEANHAIAGNFLVAHNEVPFFKAALLSGAAIVLLLLVLFNLKSVWGIWIMILTPGIVQLAYQNWRWPYVLLQQLKS